MNDDELRDHLRSTLEPVSPAAPELARLRRLARRRRRRMQVTASALGVALVAGAGIGIAAATSGNSGRAVVTAGSSPSASVVTVPCRTAQVSLQIGQTLQVAPCPDVSGHIVGAVPAAGVAVSPRGSATFHADQRGLSTLQIEYVGCAVPSEYLCTLDQRSFGTITVTVGPKYVKGAPPASVPCKGGRVTVLVGQQLGVAGCPAGVSSHVDDPTVLMPGASPNSFTAKKAGTTNVELSVKPVCSPGMMCPRYIRDLGTLVVTVTHAG